MTVLSLFPAAPRRQKRPPRCCCNSTECVPKSKMHLRTAQYTLSRLPPHSCLLAILLEPPPPQIEQYWKRKVQANKNLPMTSAMANRVTVGILAATSMTTTAVCASKWDLVAPESLTLPYGQPPSSFTRQPNTIEPSGVSEGLDVRPSRLHTNKFYSNFLVSAFGLLASVESGAGCSSGRYYRNKEKVQNTWKEKCYVPFFGYAARSATIRDSYVSGVR